MPVINVKNKNGNVPVLAVSLQRGRIWLKMVKYRQRSFIFNIRRYVHVVGQKWKE